MEKFRGEDVIGMLKGQPEANALLEILKETLNQRQLKLKRPRLWKKKRNSQLKRAKFKESLKNG
jgi:hypothetical protein